VQRFVPFTLPHIDLSVEDKFLGGIGGNLDLSIPQIYSLVFLCAT
jgi:hypothetical protein